MARHVDNDAWLSPMPAGLAAGAGSRSSFFIAALDHVQCQVPDGHAKP